MTTRLISITPDAEKTMLYVARVSSLRQESKSTGLLGYCLKHEHWSVFEHAFMTNEIETSRAISPQILRHRSFTFSEFSQRYSAVEDDPEFIEARYQDTKNRQNSIICADTGELEWWDKAQEEVWDLAHLRYEQAITKGIAKEVARNLLPAMTPTKLYMSGSVRSWLHYINLRSGNGTQKEHQDIALGCKEIFTEQLPIIAKALGWTNEAT